MPAKKTAEPKKAMPQATMTEANRGMAVISYLWIFCFVPLLFKQDDPYIQFHAKQGVVLALAWFLLHVVGIVPILGWVIYFVGWPILAVVNLVAIIKAWSGEQWKIPYLYDYVAYLNL